VGPLPVVKYTTMETTFEAIVRVKFRSKLRAATAAGVHENTLGRAMAGHRVSAESRHRIESLFGATLEELREPATREFEVVAR
jgi:hypothetical protein